MKKLNILLFLSTVVLLTIAAVVGTKIHKNVTKNSYYLSKNGFELHGESKVKNLNNPKKNSIDYTEFLKRSPNRLADLMLEKKRVLNIVYVEVNDVNPLNCLEYKFEDGEPFFDVVILFADNFVWSTEKNKAVIKHNSNVKAILQNREVYIKPLQDAGIKVLVDYLPHHSGLGYKNLNDDDIEELSNQMVKIVEDYRLDGIDLDEEYAGYGNIPKPKINGSMVKFVYALRKKMPDKIVSVFDWDLEDAFGETQSFGDPGLYMDFSYHGAYGGTKKNWIKGLKNKFYSEVPLKVQKEYPNFIENTLLNNAKRSLGDTSFSTGYGVHMFFNIQPMTSADAFSALAEYTYGRRVSRTNIEHKKNWI